MQFRGWIIWPYIFKTSKSNPSNPLTPMSDQDKISPYNINTISSRQVMRIERNINLGIFSWSSNNFSERKSYEIYSTHWGELLIRSCEWKGKLKANWEVQPTVDNRHMSTLGHILVLLPPFHHIWYFKTKFYKFKRWGKSYTVQYLISKFCAFSIY